jgi:hypothetical protein
MFELKNKYKSCGTAMCVYVSSETVFEIWFYFESDTESKSDKMTVLDVCYRVGQKQQLILEKCSKFQIFKNSSKRLKLHL